MRKSIRIRFKYGRDTGKSVQEFKIAMFKMSVAARKKDRHSRKESKERLGIKNTGIEI